MLDDVTALEVVLGCIDSEGLDTNRHHSFTNSASVNMFKMIVLDILIVRKSV